MINVVTGYQFLANQSKIILPIPIVDYERVIRVINISAGVQIYNKESFAQSWHNEIEISNQNEIIFDYDNSGMLNTDKLYIEYDFFFDLIELLNEKADLLNPLFEGTLFLPTGTNINAPLRFIEGFLRTILQSGAMEYANKSLYFTIENERKKMQMCEHILLNDVTIGNVLTETNIYQFVLNANTLKQGKMILPKLFGRFSKNVSSQIIIRIKINNIQVSTVTSNTGAINSIPFELWIIGTIRQEGISGNLQAFLKMTIDNVTNDADATNAIPINTTIQNTITITAQWTAQNTANIFTLSQGYTEFI